MPLPPMTNAVPSPSGESAVSPPVSCTARTWTWDAGGGTGAAMRQVPAIATPALRQQRRARRNSRVLQNVGRDLCTLTPLYCIYCTMVELIGSGTLNWVTAGRLGETEGTV
jgi:hypothetical protein